MCYDTCDDCQFTQQYDNKVVLFCNLLFVLNVFITLIGAHGPMGRRIDPSWGEPIELFLDWRNKGCGMYYPVCGMMHVKRTLAANWKE